MPNKGRPLGTRNKKHTNRRGQVTLRVDPELLAEWREICEKLGVTMSARFEQQMRQDIGIYGAFGVEGDK
jgi:hypothetical protein